MKITYIFHSAFYVESDRHILIFDYFKGELPEFSKNKSIIVMASHKHYDHYDKKIFELADQYDNIQFLLSNDIKMNKKYMDRIEIPQAARDKIRYVKKNQKLTIDSELKVETLESTDAGVAFIVTLEGKTIYHAGDLNWWIWKGESPEEYEEMTSAFLKQMKKVEERSFDVACLPLDPRQEEFYYYGFNYFMKHTKTKVAIPMHFWEQPEIIDALLEREEASEYAAQIIKLTKEGDYYEF